MAISTKYTKGIPSDPDDCSFKCTTETIGAAIAWADTIGAEYEACPCHKAAHFHIRVKKKKHDHQQAH